MSPEEHYRTAERLLMSARQSQPSYDKDRLLAEAQVHATLATVPWSTAGSPPTTVPRPSSRAVDLSEYTPPTPQERR